MPALSIDSGEIMLESTVGVMARRLRRFVYGRECIDSGTYSTITDGNRQFICKEEPL